MLFLKVRKGADEPGGISGVNAVRGNITGYDGTGPNDHVVSNAGIAKNNAVRSDKDVVSDFDNANSGVNTGFGGAGIVSQKPNVACQRHIVSDRDQPGSVRVNGIAAVVLKVPAGGKAMGIAVVHCGFFGTCPRGGTKRFKMSFNPIQSKLQYEDDFEFDIQSGGGAGRKQATAFALPKAPGLFSTAFRSAEPE